MKIGIVTQPWTYIDYPFDGADAIGAIVTRLAEHLAAIHRVTVYAPRFRNQPVETTSPAGVTVRRIRQFRHISSVADTVRALAGVANPDPTEDGFARSFAEKVGRRFAEDPPDIVHVVNFSQFAPVVRQQVPSAKIVLHMQCFWLDEGRRGVVARRLATIDRVMACSTAVADALRSRFPEYADRVDVVANGVDSAAFCVDDDFGDGAERISFVGRLSPEKGVHLAIDAFADIADDFPSACLSLTGPNWRTPPEYHLNKTHDSVFRTVAQSYPATARERWRALSHPSESYVQAQLDALRPDLRARIEQGGSVANAKMPAIYARAAIVCLPSVWNEPFGIPAIEAMAAGKPVIASRGGGFSDSIVDGETGILVERNDRTQLADAMRRLLGSPGHRAEMGAAGRRRAAALFDWRVIASRVGQSYEKALAGPGRQPPG